MTWRTTDDVEEFLANAGEWLRQRPEEHTLQLTIAEMVRRQGPGAFGGGSALFGWYATDEVAAAFTFTLPYPPALTGASTAVAAALAEQLADEGQPVTGITADEAAAKAFTDAWCARAGTTSRVRFRQRLYRLTELAPPDPGPPGRARTATTDDRDLLVRWLDDFSRDAGEPPRDSGAVADARLRYGGFLLWEVDGVPVALAGHTQTVAAMSRIGPVYTPAERRRQGFGAAVTVAATRAAQAHGADHVVLFTDLANPTSNSIYQRIGYRPIADSVVVEFIDP
jgi:GNAT superfamily N-acetyltransferase